MKKIISMICVAVILFVSVIPVSASDNNEQTLTSTELSVKRITAELTGKTEKELAKDILRELGMPERIIRQVNEEYLEKVYSAKCISTEKEYGKFTEDKTAVIVTEEEYLEEAATKVDDGVMMLSLTGETEDSYPDKYFLKSIYAIETKNAETGTIAVLCSFEWLDEPLFRCKDAIAISGTNVVFDEEETIVSMGYTQTVTNMGSQSITATDVIEDYDFHELDLEGNTFFAGDFVSAACNLPNDVPAGTINVNCTDIVLLIMASCVVNEINPNQQMNLSFTGWYFHQTIGWETSIEISKESASLSITPSWMYRDPSQIQIKPKFSV
ncbi:MAG: hypothetical protein IJZ16_11660 [Clostridia bacterium]|nr:hypothetical protein [Clostridia bacterium]